MTGDPGAGGSQEPRVPYVVNMEVATADDGTVLDTDANRSGWMRSLAKLPQVAREAAQRFEPWRLYCVKDKGPGVFAYIVQIFHVEGGHIFCTALALRRHNRDMPDCISSLVVTGIPIECVHPCEQPHEDKPPSQTPESP